MIGGTGTGKPPSCSPRRRCRHSRADWFWSVPTYAIEQSTMEVLWTRDNKRPMECLVS